MNPSWFLLPCFDFDMYLISWNNDTGINNNRTYQSRNREIKIKKDLLVIKDIRYYKYYMLQLEHSTRVLNCQLTHSIAETSLLGGGEGVGLLSLTAEHEGIVKIGLLSFLLEAITCTMQICLPHFITLDPSIRINH